MKIIKSIKELQSELKTLEGTIGFVPTMGYLHEGHIALVKRAKEISDHVIMSIYVNPLQFGPNEDFDAYPRDLERDAKIAENNGVDIIFAPDDSEMYPSGLEFEIHIATMAKILDGKRRPGHFEGVVTVVNKLFNIIQPDYAIFGEKDRQQLMIIERMVKDFNHQVEIVGVATEREVSGLAKSSRNVYLTEKELEEAPEIFKALCNAKRNIKNGNTNAENIKDIITSHIHSFTSGVLDDVSIYTMDLNPVDIIDEDVIIFIAVKFSKARLIDNMKVSIQ